MNTQENLILPTPQQVQWADCEIGVIIHQDVETYVPSFDPMDFLVAPPPAQVFAPTALNTDQWLETAKKAGAKYAVLVAKHCSGFSLWPTKAHDYSVASCPWKDGKGDIVADFIASCKKYDIRPGLYCSTVFSSKFGVNNDGHVRSGDPQEQARYNQVVLTQLTELWSNYGELFEFWFDGGLVAVEDGGPDLAPLLEKYQPNTVRFQGPPQLNGLLRWVGNERGDAPYPCWSTSGLEENNFDGTVDAPNAGGGTPFGKAWIPAESDFPNRDQNKAFQGGWFWQEGQDDTLYTVDTLVERYLHSVGHNTNMLIGMVIDNRGLVPDADVAQFEQFGKAVADLLCDCKGSTSGEGMELLLEFEEPTDVDMAVLQEEIAKGERVRAYTLWALSATNEWVEIEQGSCIGHKRIVTFEKVKASALKLTITESVGQPLIRNFAGYCTGGNA